MTTLTSGWDAVGASVGRVSGSPLLGAAVSRSEQGRGAATPAGAVSMLLIVARVGGACHWAPAHQSVGPIRWAAGRLPNGSRASVRNNRNNSLVQAQSSRFLWDVCMDILGINAAFHDSSACLVRDGGSSPPPRRSASRGSSTASARRRTGPRAAVPRHRLLPGAPAGMTLADVDDVAYSFDPFLLTAAPPTAASRCRATSDDPGRRAGTSPGTRSSWPSSRPRPRMLRDDVPFHLRERLNGVPHATAGAFTSWSTTWPTRPAPTSRLPFDRAAVLTLDGRGECVSTYLRCRDGQPPGEAERGRSCRTRSGCSTSG